MTGITSNPENLIAWLLDHSHLEIPDSEPTAIKATVPPPQVEEVEVVETENDESSSDEDVEDNDFSIDDSVAPLGKYCLHLYLLH